jgi:Ser/Thr protein kinase RdoA (MazF antagonist)
MTSHRIDVVAPGWLRKDLSEAALVGDARNVQSRPLHDPSREPAAYRCLLAPAGIRPRCRSAGPDWVVLEHLEGAELWQFGDFDVWLAAARALARAHAQLAAQAWVSVGASTQVPFLVHDDGLALYWQTRAASAGLPDHVLRAHERSSERLGSLTRTVIHGDAYASNIIISPSRRGREPEVTLIDWELVGLGPAVLDLAALVAGSWTEAEIELMAHAYITSAHELGSSARSHDDWLTDLLAARLRICVQWLCWAPEWRPPAAHRHDWLTAAEEMTQRL